MSSCDTKKQDEEITSYAFTHGYIYPLLRCRYFRGTQLRFYRPFFCKYSLNDSKHGLETGACILENNTIWSNDTIG